MAEKRLARSNTWVRLLAALSVMVLLMAACGGDDDDGGTDAGGSAEPTDDTDAEETPESPANIDRDAEFRLAINYPGNVFDPHRSPAATGDANYMMPVYDRLTMLVENDDGTVEVGPQLATSWDFAEDALSVEFELRDDVVFQDGTPFDADAVKANIERAKDPESTIASIMAPIDSVEVVDENHVVFNLNKPYPGILYDFATSTNGMMASPAAFDSDLATTPVGSGPYTLASFNPESGGVYERWDDHWDPDAALASQFSIVPVGDPNARLNGLRSGDFDAIFAQGVDAEARDQGFQFTTDIGPQSTGLLVNNSMEPFDDVNVIKALSMAIDRPQLVPIQDGLAPPMYQDFAEGYVGYVPELDENPYDPEAAAQLIREAGVEGQSVTLLTLSNEPYASIAQVVQQSLGDIGLEVSLVPVGPAEGFPRWLQGGDAFWVGPITNEGEPSVSMQKNYLGLFNVGDVPAELQELSDDALGLPLGSEERNEAYQDISRYLHDNPIHVPLVQAQYSVAGTDRVFGISEIIKISSGKAEVRGVGLMSQS